MLQCITTENSKTLVIFNNRNNQKRLKISQFNTFPAVSSNSTHLVSNLQMKVTGFRMIAQVYAITIVTYNVLCSRIRVEATMNKLG